MILGGLCILSGLSAAAGVVDASDPVQKLMHPVFIQVWGILFTVGIVAWIWGVSKNDLPAEKLGLRFTSISIMSYVVAVILVTWHDPKLGAIIIGILSVWFSLWAEVRVTVIRQLLKPWTPPDIPEEPDGS
jgi:hypothetical protein